MIESGINTNPISPLQSRESDQYEITILDLQNKSDYTASSINKCERQYSRRSIFGNVKCHISRNMAQYEDILKKVLDASPKHKPDLSKRSKSLTRVDNEELVKSYDNFEINQISGLLKEVKRSKNYGHCFLPIIMDGATWCDRCGRYILAYYQHCLQCSFCHFTCHVGCRTFITFECPSQNFNQTLRRHKNTKNVSRNISPLTEPINYCCDENIDPSLIENINQFNENKHGLLISLRECGFMGSIRVHMNLFRPITMVLAATPPISDYADLPTSVHPPQTHHISVSNNHLDSWYEDDVVHLSPRRISRKSVFHMPKDTSTTIYINDNTTTLEVIEILLGKFCIADDPCKFALYHKSTIHNGVHTMRRLGAEELPLVLCFYWFLQSGTQGLSLNKFVLQETDSGEVSWEMFSLPELENIIKMLGLEENEKERQIRHRYKLLRQNIQSQISEKLASPLSSFSLSNSINYNDYKYYY